MSTVYSVDDLVAGMQPPSGSSYSQSSTDKWDVVASYSTDQLNKLLATLWTSQSAPTSSIIVYTTDYNSDGSPYTIGWNVTLTAPTLSFDSAGFATLTMGLSGDYQVNPPATGTWPSTKPIESNINLIATVPLASVKADEKGTILQTSQSGQLISFDNNDGSGVLLHVVIDFEQSNAEGASYKIVSTIGSGLDGNIVSENIVQMLFNEAPAKTYHQVTQEGLTTKLQRWFANAQGLSLQYALASVSSAAPTSGVTLTPQSMIFTTYTANDKSSSCLSIYIQTVESGNQPGNLVPAFKTLNNNTTALPIPSDTFNASIIINRQVFGQTFLVNCLSKVTTTLNGGTPLAFTSVAVAPSDQGISINCTLNTTACENMSKSSWWGGDLTVDNVNWDLGSTPLMLNIVGGQSQWSYQFNNSVSWSDVEHGSGGTSYETTGITDYSLGLNISRATFASLSNSDIVAQVSLLGTDWAPTITAEEPTEKQRILDNMVDTVPNEVTNGLNAIQKPTLNNHLDLNFFATTNVLAPGHTMIDISGAQSIYTPYDVIIFGTVEAPSQSAADIRVKAGLRLPSNTMSLVNVDGKHQVHINNSEVRKRKPTGIILRKTRVAPQNPQTNTHAQVNGIHLQNTRNVQHMEVPQPLRNLPNGISPPRKAVQATTSPSKTTTVHSHPRINGVNEDENSRIVINGTKQQSTSITETKQQTLKRTITPSPWRLNGTAARNMATFPRGNAQAYPRRMVSAASRSPFINDLTTGKPIMNQALVALKSNDDATIDAFLTQAGNNYTIDPVDLQTALASSSAGPGFDLHNVGGLYQFNSPSAMTGESFVVDPASARIYMDKAYCTTTVDDNGNVTWTSSNKTFQIAFHQQYNDKGGPLPISFDGAYSIGTTYDASKAIQTSGQQRIATNEDFSETPAGVTAAWIASVFGAGFSVIVYGIDKYLTWKKEKEQAAKDAVTATAAVVTTGTDAAEMVATQTAENVQLPPGIKLKTFRPDVETSVSQNVEANLQRNPDIADSELQTSAQKTASVSLQTSWQEAYMPILDDLLGHMTGFIGDDAMDRIVTAESDKRLAEPVKQLEKSDYVPELVQAGVARFNEAEATKAESGAISDLKTLKGEIKSNKSTLTSKERSRYKQAQQLQQEGKTEEQIKEALAGLDGEIATLEKKQTTLDGDKTQKEGERDQAGKDAKTDKVEEGKHLSAADKNSKDVYGHD